MVRALVVAKRGGSGEGCRWQLGPVLARRSHSAACSVVVPGTSRQPRRCTDSPQTSAWTYAWAAHTPCPHLTRTTSCSVISTPSSEVATGAAGPYPRRTAGSSYLEGRSERLSTTARPHSNSKANYLQDRRRPAKGTAWAGGQQGPRLTNALLAKVWHESTWRRPRGAVVASPPSRQLAGCCGHLCSTLPLCCCRYIKAMPSSATLGGKGGTDKTVKARNAGRLDVSSHPPLGTQQRRWQRACPLHHLPAAPLDLTCHSQQLPGLPPLQRTCGALQASQHNCANRKTPSHVCPQPCRPPAATAAAPVCKCCRCCRPRATAAGLLEFKPGTEMPTLGSTLVARTGSSTHVASRNAPNASQHLPQGGQHMGVVSGSPPVPAPPACRSCSGLGWAGGCTLSCSSRLTGSVNLAASGQRQAGHPPPVYSPRCRQLGVLQGRHRIGHLLLRGGRGGRERIQAASDVQLSVAGAEHLLTSGDAACLLCCGKPWGEGSTAQLWGVVEALLVPRAKPWRRVGAAGTHCWSGGRPEGKRGRRGA